MTDDAFPVVIHHNSRCGTSRNVVEMVRAAGYDPTIVPYLETGWTRPQLLGLLDRAGMKPRDVLREKEAAALAPELLDPSVSDETILAAMLAQPILVNRPIVATPKGVALCRPSERVFDLLDRAPGTFVKEDGEVVGKSKP